MTGNPNRVTTTERSLEIVEVIQEARGATLSQITDRTDFAKSTIHKHLRTLAQYGYLEKKGERYDLGLKFYNKGNYIADTRSYFEIAKRVVEELSEELEEDIEFVVENDGKGIVVAAAYHKRSKYSADQHLGTYYPLHATAAGKMILAGFSTEQIKQIISKWRMDKHTDNTITSETKLLDEIEEIRERGYARSDEEFAEGLRAVAKRVDAPDGSILGAISVLAPIYRMPEEDFKQYIPQMIAKKAVEFENELDERTFYR
ncbi:IclR family transcriptional regulator [Haladaptatus pallidirubidus]|nr:IclR family transcriptional regulator [Haladaptatus pallidirubidus]